LACAFRLRQLGRGAGHLLDFDAAPEQVLASRHGAFALGHRFFEAGRAPTAVDWTVMRDRWERSHVLRAIASVLALVLLTTAVAL
jgi:hypothetical protein